MGRLPWHFSTATTTFGHWTGSADDIIVPFLGVPSSTRAIGTNERRDIDLEKATAVAKAGGRS
jgi:hypothetical protein